LIGIMFLAPVFQLFLFGYAVTTDLNHISMAVYDADRTAESRALVDRFIRSGYFEYKHVLTDADDIDQMLDTGQVQLVVSIPCGFSEDLAVGNTPQVQTIVDGTDSMTARIIAGYATGVMQQYAGDITEQRLARAGGTTVRLPGLDARLRVWYNPDLKSVNFMVPGVLCLILLLVTMLMTAMSIVKEKELGTLEQLVVTPITPIELMLGKTLPFLLVGLLDMVLVLLVATLGFHVSVAGSVLLLFVLSTLFLLTTLGLGIYISTISKTQQEATLTCFFFFMPFVLLSGFIFPIENMPASIRWITYGIPLRYFLEIIRGIFLKGSTIRDLIPQILVLAAFGVGILTLSARRFSKRLG
jgi:ABC-2 type transport system permease protein